MHQKVGDRVRSVYIGRAWDEGKARDQINALARGCLGRESVPDHEIAGAVTSSPPQSPERPLYLVLPSLLPGIRSAAPGRLRPQGESYSALRNARDSGYCRKQCSIRDPIGDRGQADSDIFTCRYRYQGGRLGPGRGAVLVALVESAHEALNAPARSVAATPEVIRTYQTVATDHEQGGRLGVGRSGERQDHRSHAATRDPRRRTSGYGLVAHLCAPSLSGLTPRPCVDAQVQKPDAESILIRKDLQLTPLSVVTGPELHYPGLICGKFGTFGGSGWRLPRRKSGWLKYLSNHVR